MARSVGEVAISSPTIRLGQFLKLANMIDSGADAKAAIAGGEVTVNDVVEVRRGRQLHSGDTVAFGDQSVRVANP